MHLNKDITSDCVFFPIQVVICVKLHLPFLCSACLAHLLSEFHNFLSFDSSFSLVVNVTVVYVRFLVCVDLGESPHVIALFRHMGRQLREEVGSDDCHSDCVTVVHQELTTGQVDLAETHIFY